MSCKSAIYTALQTQSTLSITYTAGVNLPLGTTIRRFGCNLDLSGNGILAAGGGYFDFDVNVVVTPAAAGVYTLRLLKDGVPVAGAFQSIAAAAGATVAFNIPAIVRNQCCDSNSTLTLNLTTTATLPASVTIGNAAVVAEKI